MGRRAAAAEIWLCRVDGTHLSRRTTDRYPGGVIVIGCCRIELYLPGNGSLKGKRHILKPLMVRLQREFNVAVAEVGHNDVWQSAELALVTVANDPGFVHSALENVVRWVERNATAVQVVDWAIEII